MSTQLNTMIRVSKETRERLASIGSKRDTYEKIIQNLLESKGSTFPYTVKKEGLHV